MAFWMWITAIGIFAIAEILTTNFVFLSLAIAALAGGVAYLVGGNIPVQWVVAAALSVISLRFIRPVALKYLYKKSDSTSSWIESFIGMEATALTDITEAGGQVRVQNEVWTANSSRDVPQIPAGAQVKIERVNGAILSVSLLSNYEERK